jgi:predicted DNA-binding protein
MLRHTDIHINRVSTVATKRGRKVMIPVYVEPEQKEALKQLNEATRVPVAEYVREGIDMVLEKYQKHLEGNK